MEISNVQLASISGMLKGYEDQIYQRTGVIVVLRPHYPSLMERLKPEHLLELVASALDMDKDDFANKCRRREYVLLRRVGCVLIRVYFPKMGVKRIGQLMGGYDHTSIIDHFKKAQNHFDTNDELFIEKYNLAKKLIDECLRAR